MSRVVTVTRPLDRTTVDQLAHEMARTPPDGHVTVDLTAVPDFDSEGAEGLLELQDRVGPQRLSIVGMRQAAARLTGTESDERPAPVDVDGDAIQVTRLERTMVLRAMTGARLTERDVVTALDAVADHDAAIVVVDLKDAAAVTASALAALVYASSDAAVAGRELLIVNIDAEAAQWLRRAGLSATTYVAPSPLDQPPSPER